MQHEHAVELGGQPFAAGAVHFDDLDRRAEIGQHLRQKVAGLSAAGDHDALQVGIDFVLVHSLADVFDLLFLADEVQRIARQQFRTAVGHDDLTAPGDGRDQHAGQDAGQITDLRVHEVGDLIDLELQDRDAVRQELAVLQRVFLRQIFVDLLGAGQVRVDDVVDALSLHDEVQLLHVFRRAHPRDGLRAAQFLGETADDDVAVVLVRRRDQKVVIPDLQLFHDVHALGVGRDGQDVVAAADFLDQAFVLVDQCDLISAAEQGFRDGAAQLAGSYDCYFHIASTNHLITAGGIKPPGSVTLQLLLPVLPVPRVLLPAPLSQPPRLRPWQRAPPSAVPVRPCPAGNGRRTFCR